MEFNQKELKKHLKALVKDVKEWNPGKELPEETGVFLKKKEVSIEDFWALRKIYALSGLNVSPPLYPVQKEP